MKIDEIGAVGKITKQNATKDAPIGSEFANVKKLGLGSGKPQELHKKARKNSTPNKLFNLGLVESYSKDMDEKWFVDNISKIAKKYNIDPKAALQVWRSEGGMSWQSKFKPKGKKIKTVGGKEASYGPFQLYTGKGGLGAAWEKEFGKKLSTSTSKADVLSQIDYALKTVPKRGWQDFKGAKRIGLDQYSGVNSPNNPMYNKLPKARPDNVSKDMYNPVVKPTKKPNILDPRPLLKTIGDKTGITKDFKSMMKQTKKELPNIEVDKDSFTYKNIVKPAGKAYDYISKGFTGFMKNMKNDPKFKEIGKRQRELYGPKEDKVTELRIVKPDPKDTLGIPRKNMPQIKKQDYEEFIEYLQKNGATFKREEVPADELKAMQAEFSDAGVLKQLKKDIDKNYAGKAIIVSEDDYVLDGHHRWLVAKNTGRDLDVFRVNMPAYELFDLVNEFEKVYYKDITNERGSIGVPLSSGLTVSIFPHRPLKIKKPTKGKLNYDEARGSCWHGYEQKGFKKKGDRMVPNCVKEDVETEGAVYDLLLETIGAGPFDGGCVVVAQALQRIHGGQVMGLVRKDGIVEHAVVQNGDTMYDFDGPGSVEEVIKRFESNERTNITDVRPLQKTDLPDAPRDINVVEKLIPLLKDMVKEDVTQADLNQLEQFADKLFGKVGIDVEFTRHFLDRVNDERNRKPITPAELTRLFKQEYKRYGKPIAKMGPDKEAVMKDLQTNLNLPFALVYDRQNNELDLIAKTIMRKDDFKTPNKVFAVEDLNTQRGRLEYYLKQPKISDNTVLHLGNLPKYHDGKDELAELVPERNGVYALYPDAWEGTFYSLTNKDLNKVTRYKPALVKVPEGSIVADMAIANQFYRTKDDKEKAQLAKAYKESIVQYGDDTSHMKLPEIIMPRLIESVEDMKIQDVIDEDLRDWFKQKWVNIGAKKKGGGHPECGTSGKKSGYAKCVPASKAARMTKKEKESAVRRKRAAQNKKGRGGKKSGSGKGKKPIRVSTKAKK